MNNMNLKGQQKSRKKEKIIRQLDTFFLNAVLVVDVEMLLDDSCTEFRFINYMISYDPQSLKDDLILEYWTEGYNSNTQYHIMFA